MPRHAPNNPIGESIYNQIKDYDITSRKAFFKTISAEDKELYSKYNTYQRGLNRNPRYQDIETAREKAQQGMRETRARRTKEEIAQQRKPYDAKYNVSRNLTIEEMAKAINIMSQDMKEISNEWTEYF